MKHLFVVNPKAGKRDNSAALVARIETIFKNRADEYEIAVTGHAGHATEIARAAAEQGNPIRIYSVGGDGTLHEILLGCYAYENVELAAFPAGTGNDFVKSFPQPNFDDLQALVNGQSTKIDLLKCNDAVAINIVNCGFDAEVAKNVSRFKRMFSGSLAYYISLFYSFIKKIHFNLTVVVDGTPLRSGRAMLAAVANGRVYGGGFLAAPDALTDDGLADVVYVKGMSRLKVTAFVGRYKAGRHEKLGDLLMKTRGKKISITSDQPFAICLDGEVSTGTSCEIEILPRALNFVLPVSAC